MPEAASEENVTDKPMTALLPVHIDSTGYLLHPVGTWGRNSEDYFSSQSSSGANVYSGRDGLRGKMTNIFFQELNSEEFVPLSDKAIVITSAVFLRKIFENTGRGLLLYTVYDRDSNGDEALGEDDVRSLYISGINGKNFRKLTTEGQTFLDHSTLESLNRVYFRSYEDTNADNRLGEEDRMHLFYVDFSAEDPAVVEYDPQKAQNKA